MQRKAIDFGGVTEQAAAAKHPGEEQRQATYVTPTARIKEDTLPHAHSSTRFTIKDDAPKAEFPGNLIEVDHAPPPAARDTVAEDSDIRDALTEPSGLEEDDFNLLETSESNMTRKKKRKKAKEEEAEEELITAKLQAEKRKFDAEATLAEAKVKIAEIEVKTLLLENRKKLRDMGVLASEIEKALPL